MTWLASESDKMLVDFSTELIDNKLDTENCTFSDPNNWSRGLAESLVGLVTNSSAFVKASDDCRTY